MVSLLSTLQVLLPVGQGEVDIARVADMSIVILTPGTANEIQVMKAGILEAADIFVINKADRDGTGNLKIGLEIMLETRARLSNEWKPGIILTEAISSKGTDKLAEEILRHREYLISSGGLERRRRERAKLELMMTVESSLKNYIEDRIDKGCLEKLVNELVHRKISPPSAALKILNQL